ncbi:MAG: hypothetical protein A2Y77_15090 [Planctomycetes bacterium RBG_13_62_9]|nr:MAG: hypothetical protein A2Y77_15090 [Planctomycetes bacterium RBG_13_62_9]
MRPIAWGLIVLVAGLGLVLYARENRAPDDRGYAGEASRRLVNEHELILTAVDAIQAEAADIRRGFTLDRERVRRIVDFSRNFTDQYHDAKEERYYFPAVRVYAGQQVYGLISELEAEHAYGRAIVDQIEYLLRSTDRAVARIIAERLATYADMLRRHIQKENSLFQRADETLSGEEQRATLIAFDRFEKIETIENTYDKYYNFAQELRDKLRRREE